MSETKDDKLDERQRYVTEKADANKRGLDKAIRTILRERGITERQFLRECLYATSTVASRCPWDWKGLDGDRMDIPTGERVPTFRQILACLTGASYGPPEKRP